jgi:hypothetical protein
VQVFHELIIIILTILCWMRRLWERKVDQNKVLSKDTIEGSFVNFAPISLVYNMTWELYS